MNQESQSYTQKQQVVPARIRYQTEFAEENEAHTLSKESKINESLDNKKNQ